MNSRSLAIVIHRIALATCCFAPAIALAQAGSSVAELGDLVKSLLAPASAKPDPPSWGLGAHPAVRWNSTTPQPSETHLVNDGLPMSRTGVAQIAVKGQWNVTLAGSLASPLEVRLEMAKFDSAGGWLDPAAVLKGAGFKVETTCKSGEISSGTSLYAVRDCRLPPGTTGTHVVVRQCWHVDGHDLRVYQGARREAEMRVVDLARGRQREMEAAVGTNEG